MTDAPILLSQVHEVRDSCLCLATQRAARRLARRFDKAFKPVGLTNQQFSLLMPLNAPQPQPMRAGTATTMAMAPLISQCSHGS